MQDPTEDIRRVMIHCLHAGIESSEEEQERQRLENTHGKGNVYNTEELRTQFEVIGFMAPFCIVLNRKTGEKGTFMFQHSPRLYFGFKTD